MKCPPATAPFHNKERKQSGKPRALFPTRPLLENDTLNDYDTVFIGSSNWFLALSDFQTFAIRGTRRGARAGEGKDWTKNRQN